MMDIQRAGTAILFCSHNMHQVVQFCQRVAWLEHGQVKALGEAGEIVDRYVAQDLSAAQDRHTQPRSRAPIEARRCIVEAVTVEVRDRALRIGRPLIRWGRHCHIQHRTGVRERRHTKHESQR